MTGVSRRWPNATIVCLAPGPSLSAEDVALVRSQGHPVIAINDAHRLAPWADVLYASDFAWWQEYRGVPTFRGLKVSVAPRHRQPPPGWPWSDVQVLANTGDYGLEASHTGLRTGRNSGAAAINLAVHLGAARILLLGYDLCDQPGRSHFFGEHPDRLRRSSPYPMFIEAFQRMVDPLAAIGVDVINCSRQTALTCFRRQPLADAIAPREAVA